MSPNANRVFVFPGGIEAFTDGMEVTELDEVPQCMEKMTSCGKPLIGTLVLNPKLIGP